MKRSHEHAESCEYIHVHEDIVKSKRQNAGRRHLVLTDLADFKIFGDTTRIKIVRTALFGDVAQ